MFISSEIEEMLRTCNRMAVLRDGATHTNYDLTLPDGVELVPADGGYDLVAAGDAANLVLGTIEEPWAVDADGRDVATSY